MGSLVVFAWGILLQRWMCFQQGFRSINRSRQNITIYINFWCLTKQHLESNTPWTAALVDSDFIWFLNLYSKVSQMGGYFWDTRVFSFWGWSLLMGLQCRKFNIAQNGDTFSKPSFFHPKFRVPKMEGFLNLMFGYFGWWGPLHNPYIQLI